MKDTPQRSMIEEMFNSGSITEDEYEEMLQRMDKEKEQAAHEQRQKRAWENAKAVFNAKGCKKGVAAIEAAWADINQVPCGWH
jgi:succinate dehydrogenase/fumarate reductase flavoprotein subunit